MCRIFAVFAAGLLLGLIVGDGLPEADAVAYREFRERYLAFAAALRPLFENRPPRLATKSSHCHAESAKRPTTATLRMNRKEPPKSA